MTKSNNILLLAIIIVFAFTLWVILPDTKLFGREDLQLGLDLKGGVHLVYEVEFADNTTSAEQQVLMDSTILKIEQRIDKFGVTEPVIQQVGSNRIMIQLPGFTDIEAAKSLVQQTGFLEFREVERDTTGKLITLDDYFKQSSYQFIDTKETSSRLFVDLSTENFGRLVAVLAMGENGIVLTDAQGNPADNTTLQDYKTAYAWIPSRGNDGTPLTGSLLKDAQPGLEQQTNRPVVDIEWNSEGAVIFDQIAARLHNPAGEGGGYSFQYVLGIFLDQKLLSAPQIISQNYQGRGTISGSFTVEKARETATLLKSGSLPMPIGTPIFQDKVSATLGAEFVDKSIIAGIIGLALVIIFMVAYYRIPGLMASLALIFYGTLTLAIFKLWPVTLSLGGIGGFIVSMGIAVDANVLIFERMKEEFRMGRTLGAAIEAGFHRAWSAIWDSNVTTFIACIILYWLGSAAMHNAAIIGFAVTLFVGAIVSMFTAVLVTRTLLRAIGGTGLAKHPALFTVTGGKK